MNYAIAAAIAVVLLGLALGTPGNNQEYERAALFRFGRLGTTKGPGLLMADSSVDRVVKNEMSGAAFHAIARSSRRHDVSAYSRLSDKHGCLRQTSCKRRLGR